MRRFYSSAINHETREVVLNQEETRHLRDVLRLRTGEKVGVFDGAGKEFACRIIEIGKKETRLEILEETNPAAPESNLDLTLAVALLKGEKFDLVVQKSCELGVSRIVPLVTKRADVKLKDAKETEKKLERWRKIVLESSKQCGRAKLMRIESPTTFEQFAKTSDGISLFFSERNGENFENFAGKNIKPKKVTAFIGSEGGWDDAEITTARENNFQIITLGGRILRAETAAITIPTLLQNHFGDLN
jgi:16S rRNA (uracil1498-N3)-methyltransferase